MMKGDSLVGVLGRLADELADPLSVALDVVADLLLWKREVGKSKSSGTVAGREKNERQRRYSLATRCLVGRRRGAR